MTDISVDVLREGGRVREEGEVCVQWDLLCVQFVIFGLIPWSCIETRKREGFPGSENWERQKR